MENPEHQHRTGPTQHTDGRAAHRSDGPPRGTGGGRPSHGSEEHAFDKAYWEEHWEQADPRDTGPDTPPNPYLAEEVRGLAPGTALDAGCGTGAEAVHLASLGWRVTGADISSAALASAAERARAAGVEDRTTWLETDLSQWRPAEHWDLVTTHYAHPAMPQLEFYRRLARWVAPGGTLLLVGHLHTHGSGDDAHTHEHGPDEHGPDEHGPDEHGHAHTSPRSGDHGAQAHGSEGTDGHGGDDGFEPPEEATVTLADMVAVLDPALWSVETAKENTREFPRPDGQTRVLHDVIVRATRVPE
ncbi:hypothetical protein GCM10022377_15300 [Zhihengliuella alba]|uniref:Methyltransferase domain-containing protein n=1 Tax=Zhihengliuella alba TaxID=547018 RepID=A0ABP7DC49_9MICC